MAVGTIRKNKQKKFSQCLNSIIKTNLWKILFGGEGCIFSGNFILDVSFLMTCSILYAKKKSWLFSVCPLKTNILWYVCNCRGQVKLDCYFDLWLKKQSGILVSCPFLLLCSHFCGWRGVFWHFYIFFYLQTHHHNY